MNRKTGLLIAASAAVLFAATGRVAGGSAAASETKIRCPGVNSCKGRGWVEVTEAGCKARGGTVMKMEGAAPAAK